MREMNRNNEIDPQKFKDYKDFSSFNPEGTPSNDEIVAALRTLQKAGLGSNVSELSLLTGTPTQQGSIYNMMGNSNISPQIMQALFSNNMSLGF